MSHVQKFRRTAAPRTPGPDQTLVYANSSGVLQQMDSAGTSTPFGSVSAGSVTATELAAGAVTLAKLAAGVAPAFITKYAAAYTTTGGAAAEAATVTGVAATDIVTANIKDNGTNNVTLLQVAATLNTLTFTFSADPGADTIVYYSVQRAAS